MSTGPPSVEAQANQRSVDNRNIDRIVEMEFAEYIKTPRLDRVTLTRPFRDPVEGVVCITGHHLIFSSRKSAGDELWLLHRMIDSVDRKASNNGGQIILKCKDFLIVQLDVIRPEDFSNAADTLELLSRVDQTAYLFPFFNRESFDIEQDGWSLYSVDKQLERLPADDWRISDVNRDFVVCPTYPERVIVPNLVEDESIKTIGSFRRLGRFPVLSYYHEKSGAVLMRSSQPMVGPNSKRCKEDERMINAVLGPGKRGYIIETRAPNLAQLAKTKGGGFEPEAHYPLWKRVHKPINRHSTLLDSLSKLIEACNDSNSSMDKWLSRVESSGWLSQVQSVLGCACLVAQCISEEGASVLVHGAEGIDSTLQVCSLAQVILDPRARTVLGFEELIEQEWLQAGHPFGTRCKRGAYASSNSRTRDQSPIFLLFLDCVYQIYYQFPCSFEFNEDFLALLYKHACASQFGTFLADCVKERKELDIPKKTVSFWSYLNRTSIIHEYLNPAFEPNPNVIWPSVAPQSIVLWNALYLKHVVDQRTAVDKRIAIAHLKNYEEEMKQKAIRLRAQLLDLMEKNEKRNA